MNKNFGRFLMPAIACFLLTGCATFYQEYEVIVMDPDPVVRRFVSLHQLRRGLTRDEVGSLLGHEVVVGYEIADRKEQRYKPLTQENPYRVEEIVKRGQKYVIDYYLVGINTSDDLVTDDELSPLVFENDLLVGWGWDYLNKHIKND